MATRVCPNCGAQYVAAVTRCADCDTELVEALSDEVVENVGLGDSEPEDQMAYELDAWSGDARVVLDGMLNRESIPHVWETGTLVVRTVDEARVDDLVDEVESSEIPTLDPDAEQVVYEISGWTDDQRADLEAILLAETVPHGFDENGDLVVLEADEERVEPILDRIDMEDVLTADAVVADGEASETEAIDGMAGDDGLVAQEVMSALFITADRLMKDPDDRDDITRFSEAVGQAETLALPYGFSPAVWDDIKAKSGALRDLIDEEFEAETADIVEAAGVVRQTLRQYV